MSQCTLADGCVMRNFLCVSRVSPGHFRKHMSGSVA